MGSDPTRLVGFAALSRLATLPFVGPQRGEKSARFTVAIAPIGRAWHERIAVASTYGAVDALPGRGKPALERRAHRGGDRGRPLLLPQAPAPQASLPAAGRSFQGLLRPEHETPLRRPPQLFFLRLSRCRPRRPLQ